MRRALTEITTLIVVALFAPNSFAVISIGNSSTIAHAAVIQPTRNQSTLIVFVRVQDGRLAVDRLKSKDSFSPSEEFKSRVARKSPANTERTINKLLQILFDDLDNKFSSLDKIYRYSLNDTEKENEPTDDLTRQVRSFPPPGKPGDWEAFSTLFQTWVDAGPDRLSLSEVFSMGQLLREIPSIGRQTALIFVPNARPVPFNASRGTLRFKVADPIGDLSDANEHTVSFPNEPDQKKVETKRKTILRLIRPLEGQLWRGSQIKSTIEEYYAERGLVGVVKISPAGKEPREIVVPEGARIARFLFHKDVLPDELDRAAYLVLPHRQFRAFVKTRPLTPVSVEDESGNSIVAYQALDFNGLGTRIGMEPFLNQFQLQIQQLELSQLGLIAVPQQTPDEVRDQSLSGSYVDIFIFKTDEEERGDKPDNVPERALPGTTSEGMIRSSSSPSVKPSTDFVPTVTNTGSDSSPQGEVDEGAATVSEVTATATATPSPAPAPRASEPWQPKDQKNYVGFGVRFKDGQGVRFFGLFQRERMGLLSANDAMSVQAGAHDGALGALNYSADFAMFKLLNHRRLTLQVTGQSEFRARRIFSGVEIDERRNGGLLRAELELFRDLSNTALRVFSEARRATVHLIRQDSVLAKQNLTTVDLGATFTFENRTAYRPSQFRLEPLFRLGVGLAQDEPRFATFSATGNYHRRLPRLMEADITGRVAFASERTPLFELPSLGGAESLRGFREDDAIGRRLWSLQTELWMPVPSTSGSESGFARFLRRQVRLAAFVDVGGAFLTTNGSTSGARLGPGVGARIIYRPAIIKIDWAYGIGDAATTGRGRGRFYFSVGTNLPF